VGGGVGVWGGGGRPPPPQPPIPNPQSPLKTKIVNVKK